MKIRVSKKIKDFAREIHKREHSFVEKKIDKDHKLEEYYYLMASYIYNNLRDEIRNMEVYASVDEKQIEELNKKLDLIMEKLGIENDDLTKEEDDAKDEGGEQE